MNGKRAKIHWFRPDEGGRKSLPTGGRFVAPARIQGVEDRWPGEAWSLVIEFDPATPITYDMEVSVKFLVPEHAPPGVLEPGGWFELFEGSRRIAAGTVL